MGTLINPGRLQQYQAEKAKILVLTDAELWRAVQAAEYDLYDAKADIEHEVTAKTQFAVAHATWRLALMHGEMLRRAMGQRATVLPMRGRASG